LTRTYASFAFGMQKAWERDQSMPLFTHFMLMR
jgi:hypothetical protein